RLEGRDTADLPSAKELLSEGGVVQAEAPCGNGINVGEGKPVRSIEIRHSTCLPCVCGIAADAGQRTAVRTRIVVDALGPGVGGEELQSMTQSLRDARL